MDCYCYHISVSSSSRLFIPTGDNVFPLGINGLLAPCRNYKDQFAVLYFPKNTLLADRLKQIYGNFNCEIIAVVECFSSFYLFTFRFLLSVIVSSTALSDTHIWVKKIVISTLERPKEANLPSSTIIAAPVMIPAAKYCGEYLFTSDAIIENPVLSSVGGLQIQKFRISIVYYIMPLGNNWLLATVKMFSVDLVPNRLGFFFIKK